ncbi:MAG TPA: hypothetical protein VF774_15025 [Pseudoduganella sp.]
MQSTPSSKAAGPDAGFLLSGNRIAKIVLASQPRMKAAPRSSVRVDFMLLMLDPGAIMLENSMKRPWNTFVGAIATEFNAGCGA